MRALAVALVSIAVLDVVAGVARGRWARAGAVAAGVAAAAAGGWAVGHSTAQCALLAVSIAVEAPLWVMGRSARRPRLVLGALSTVLAARVVVSGLWRADGDSVLDRWAQDLPFAAAQRLDASRLAYALAALLFLATAANTLVRLLLHSVPGLSLPAENEPSGGLADGDLPGGGRVIGSIERVLIFGLAIAGEATAAALVISAKGILRFAEVRAAAGERVDRVTEYVLVGSLASYTLAMAFVPLAIA